MTIARICLAAAAITLVNAAIASAAPTSALGANKIGVAAPLEKARYCHRRHHHRWRQARRPDCCDTYGYAEPVVVEPQIVVEEPLDYYAYAAPVVDVPVVVEPYGYGYYNYSPPVEFYSTPAPVGVYCNPW